MPAKTVFESTNIDPFFERVTKKTREEYVGYTFFSAPEKSNYSTYEIHFSENTGYDATNPNHKASLAAWLQNKFQPSHVEFFELKKEGQDKSIHIRFIHNLTNEEEALLMQPSCNPLEGNFNKLLNCFN